MPRLTRAEAAYLVQRGTVLVRPKRSQTPVRPPRAPSLALFATDLAEWPFVVPIEQVVCRFEMPGDPVSKARPRVALNGHVYTPATTVRWERRIRDRLAITPRAEVGPDEPLGLRIRFHTGARWRRDSDNMTKLLKDAATGIVWKDDKQVDQEHVDVERSVDDPRTEALVYRLAWLVTERAVV